MENPRVVLVGAVHEAMPALSAIARHPTAQLSAVVTLDQKSAAKVSGAVDLAGAAENRGVKSLRVADVNSPEAISRVRDLRPALLVVVGWTQLIRDELLAVPDRGCVGFHASMLPHNRGRAPVNWAILRGETTTGNTMMLLDSGVDTGQIVDQRPTPIYLADTCATTYDRIGALGADMLSENLDTLLSGRAQTRTQDEGLATHLPKRTPAMGVTDWRRSPVEIHNWIRAQTVPYPGAFTTLGGRNVRMWATEPPLGPKPSGAPGEVLGTTADGVLVACGPGSITVTSMSLEGDSPKPALHFAKDEGLQPGMHLDLPDLATSRWSLGIGQRPRGMES